VEPSKRENLKAADIDQNQIRICLITRSNPTSRQ